MKHVLLIPLALLAIATCFAGDLDSTRDANSIPFLKLSSPQCKLVVVRATLNGYSGRFLVDCGSELTVISQHMAGVYKFKVGVQLLDDNADWSGTSVTMYHAEKAALKIGEGSAFTTIQTADIDGLLGPLISRTGVQIIGIIGADALRANHLVIDFETNTLHN